MNPLTLVKRIQNINKKEANLGISEEASWHAKYKDSAYVYVGGIPFDLTEGDLLAVFAQYVFHFSVCLYIVIAQNVLLNWFIQLIFFSHVGMARSLMLT